MFLPGPARSDVGLDGGLPVGAIVGFGGLVSADFMRGGASLGSSGIVGGVGGAGLLGGACTSGREQEEARTVVSVLSLQLAKSPCQGPPASQRK